MKRLNAFLAVATSLIVVVGQLAAADSPAENKGSYLVDPRPVAKTPRFLGANAEMLELVNVYQGGLVQRLTASSRAVTITAKTLGVVSAPAAIVMPFPGR